MGSGGGGGDGGILLINHAKITKLLAWVASPFSPLLSFCVRLKKRRSQVSKIGRKKERERERERKGI